MSKYLRAYNNICNRAVNRERNNVDYYENHHITPKSLGGTLDDDNMVYLTAKEHYIAHFLLYKHYKKDKTKISKKMAFAFHSMTMNRSGKRYTSTTWAIARAAAADARRTRPKKQKPKRIWRIKPRALPAVKSHITEARERWVERVTKSNTINEL